MEDKIRQDLYNKMEKEMENYKEYLRSLSPDEIMNNSYELALKEEMMCNFYPEYKVYDIDDIKRLNKFEKPIQELYNDWMDSDMNINQLLEDNINEFFFELENEAKQKNKDRER